MAFKDYFTSKPKTEVLAIKTPDTNTSFGATREKNTFSFTPSINPLLKLNGVIADGMFNLYPNYINELCEKSPLLAAIIDFKRMLTVGNGYTVDDKKLDLRQKVKLNQLLLLFDDLLNDIGKDYHLVSKLYIKVTWNEAHDTIIDLQYVPHERIRVSEVDENYKPIEYEYCFDYVNIGMFPKTKIKPFSIYNKDKCQLYKFEIRSNGQLIYNRPKWAGGVDWAEIDKATAEFHTSNMANSLAPSALIELFEKPDTKEAKAKILQEITDSYGGVRRAGRVMVAFNSNPETAMKYTVLDAPKLDKTFLVLTDTTQRQIAFSMGIDPAILGLRVSSQLGQGVDLKESFKLFNYAQIEPAKRDLEKILNKFIAINGLAASITLNNARSLFGEVESIAPIASNESATPITKEAVSIEQQAQANLRGSVGGVQGIIQIQTSVAQGITDYSAAIVMLIEIFGFKEDVAKKLLGTPSAPNPIKPAA